MIKDWNDWNLEKGCFSIASTGACLCMYGYPVHSWDKLRWHHLLMCMAPNKDGTLFCLPYTLRYTLRHQQISAQGSRAIVAVQRPVPSLHTCIPVYTYNCRLNVGFNTRHVTAVYSIIYFSLLQQRLKALKGSFMSQAWYSWFQNGCQMANHKS